MISYSAKTGACATIPNATPIPILFKMVRWPIQFCTMGYSSSS